MENHGTVDYSGDHVGSAGVCQGSGVTYRMIS